MKRSKLFLREDFTINRKKRSVKDIERDEVRSGQIRRFPGTGRTQAESLIILAAFVSINIKLIFPRIIHQIFLIKIR